MAEPSRGQTGGRTTQQGKYYMGVIGIPPSQQDEILGGTREEQERAEAEAAALTVQQARTDWLRDNPQPDPLVAPEQYVAWVKSNPYATEADLNHAEVIIKSGYSRQPEVQQVVGERFETVLVTETGEEGKEVTKRVHLDSEEYSRVISREGQERVDGLIRLGLLPKGTLDAGASGFNAVQFNETYGTNLPTNIEYLTPDMQRYIDQIVRSQGSIRILTQKGWLRPDLTISNDAFIEAVDNPTVMQALTEVGAVQDGKVTVTTASGKEKTVTVEEYTRGIQNYRQWIADNIESDDYLNGVLAAEGEQAAVEAWEKRQTDIQAIQGRSIAKWESETLPQLPETLQKLYREAKEAGDYSKFEGGLKAYSEAMMQVSSINAGVAFNQQRDALAQLANYKDPETKGYRVGEYIADNPSTASVSVLIAAGFSQDVVDEARNYLSTLEEARNEIEVDVLGGGAAVSGYLTALGDALVTVKPELDADIMYVNPYTGKVDPQRTKMAEAWETLSDLEKRQVAGIYVADQFKGNYFAEMTKQQAIAAEELGLFGQLVTAPVLGITLPIAKSSTGQEVTPMEWIGAGVTAALDILMIAGGALGTGTLARATSLGIRGAATAYMGTNLAMNWESYTPAEKAVTFAFMGLLWSGEAIGGMRNLVKGGKSRVVIDSTIKTGANEVVAELKATTPELVKPFRDVTRAQRAFARDLARVEDIQGKIRNIDNTLEVTTSPSIRGVLEGSRVRWVEALEKAQSKASLSEAQMLKMAERYSTLSSNLATDPTVASNMKMLPQYLRQSTYDLVDNVMNPRKLGDIKWDLAQANKELREVAEANPDNPATWRDAAFKVVTYSRELSVVQSGGVNKLYYQLVKLQEQYANLLRTLRDTKSPSLQSLLERAVRETEYKMSHIRADIQNTLYEMEIMWGDDTTAFSRAKWQTDELINTILRQRRGATGERVKGVSVDIPPEVTETKLLETRGRLGEGGRGGLPEGETPPPSSDLEGTIKNNQTHIDIVDRFLKELGKKGGRVSPSTQTALDEALKGVETARKQMKTAIKMRPIETVRVVPPEELGRNVPTKVEEATKTVTRTAKRAPRTLTPPTPVPAEVSKFYPSVRTAKDDLFRRWSPARERVAPAPERLGAMTPEQARRLREEGEYATADAVSPYRITGAGEETRISPLVAPVPGTEPTPTPSVAPRPSEAPAPTEVVAPKPEPAPEPAPAPAPAPAPEPYPYPEPAPEPEPFPSPVPVPAPKTETLTTPETDTTTGLILPREGGEVQYAEIPEGSVAWKQGALWKWVPKEDFRSGVKPRTLPRGVAPLGAQISGTTPQDTIQVIGGGDVPDLQVDLGVTDAFIQDNAQTISFSGHGEKTDVGERLASPTKGMSVKGHAYARETYPEQSVSRTAISAGETSVERKGVSRTEMDEDNPREMLEIEAELGDYGEFGDEDDSWLVGRATTQKPKPRPKRRPGKSSKPMEVRRTRP